MTVNKLSLLISSASTASISAAIYSEDGQTQQGSITGYGFPNLSSVLYLQIPVSSMVLGAGVHYLAATNVFGANNNFETLTGVTAVSSPSATSVISGKEIYGGTIAIAAGVLPATITPSSIAATNTNYFQFRLDN